jgi:carbon-monoxide dehydrogenase medium subunit
VKPPPFAYARPARLEEAVALLATRADEAKPLAGGQSLLPLLNLRLARPALLVDLAGIPGLETIDEADGELRIGAMARQASLERSPLVRERCPLLVEALRHVGHPPIRNQGTIGGSLAHADPAAELPAVALLLDAVAEVQGPTAVREVPASELFVAPFTTSLGPDEVLARVRLPVADLGTWGFREIARRHGDFAVAGVVGAVVGGAVRLACFGVGWLPVRLPRAEAVLASVGPSAVTMGPPADRERSGARRAIEEGVQAAAEVAMAEVEPVADIHADAELRREALGVLVRHVVSGMLS